MELRPSHPLLVDNPSFIPEFEPRKRELTLSNQRTYDKYGIKTLYFSPDYKTYNGFKQVRRNMESNVKDEDFAVFARERNIFGKNNGYGLHLKDSVALFSHFSIPDLKDFILHLGRYYSPRPDGSDFIKDIFSVGLDDHLGHSFYAIPVSWSSKRSLSRLSFPSSTSSGIRWVRSGLNKKCLAKVPATREANIILGKMSSNVYNHKKSFFNLNKFNKSSKIDLQSSQKNNLFIPSFPPFTVGSRGKRYNRKLENEPERCGRMVVVPDLTYHLIGSLGPVHFKKVLTHNRDPMGKCLMGVSPYGNWFQYVYDNLKNFSYFMSIDFSGFDQTVPRWSLEQIIDKLYSLPYGKGEMTRRALSIRETVKRYFITTEIALPDGVVSKKERGISSGDPHTSLVGSLFNLIATRVVLLSMGVTFRNYSFGDDGIIGLNPVKKGVDFIGFDCNGYYHGKGTGTFDFQVFKSRLYMFFGLEVKDKATKISDKLEYEPAKGDSNIDFLTYYFLIQDGKVHPWRPTVELVEAIYAPEDSHGLSKYFDWKYARLYSLAIVFFRNPGAFELLIDYWDWLEENRQKPKKQVREMASSLSRTYDIDREVWSNDFLVNKIDTGMILTLYVFGSMKQFRLRTNMTKIPKFLIDEEYRKKTLTKFPDLSKNSNSIYDVSNGSLDTRLVSSVSSDWNFQGRVRDRLSLSNIL